jgi:hypothetical protein
VFFNQGRKDLIFFDLSFVSGADPECSGDVSSFEKTVRFSSGVVEWSDVHGGAGEVVSVSMFGVGIWEDSYSL